MARYALLCIHPNLYIHIYKQLINNQNLNNLNKDDEVIVLVMDTLHLNTR